MSDVRIVSVIVPCRNEHDHIEAFCRSVAAQLVPKGWLLEVWVADGLSDDQGNEIIMAARAHWFEDEDVAESDNGEAAHADPAQ